MNANGRWFARGTYLGPEEEAYPAGHMTRSALAALRTVDGPVVRVRAGCRPVMMLPRVGLQTGEDAYACVKRTPAFARRSRLGVR